MNWGSTTLAFYGVGAAALATSLAKVRRRLQLSKSKHWSLTGHARLARRVAALISSYHYDDARFFCSDDAPDEGAARRRARFERLAEVYRARFPATAPRTPQMSDTVSRLPFPHTY